MSLINFTQNDYLTIEWTISGTEPSIWVTVILFTLVSVMTVIVMIDIVHSLKLIFHWLEHKGFFSFGGN